MLSFSLKLFRKKNRSSKEDNKFDFKFTERDEFLDINLVNDKHNNKNRHKNKKTKEKMEEAGESGNKSKMTLPHVQETYSESRDEVDLSIEEMIQFTASSRGEGNMSIKRKAPDIKKRLENVRTGLYTKNLDETLLHRLQYLDVALEYFEECKFDDKMTRKIKVDKRRANNFFSAKTTSK